MEQKATKGTKMMNRRGFLAVVPALAAGALVAPTMVLNSAVPVEKPPISSIMLVWIWPSDHLNWGWRVWNTDTMEMYRKAMEESMCYHAMMAGRGYNVACHELKSVRFV